MNCLFGKKLKNESKIPFLMKLIFWGFRLNKSCWREIKNLTKGIILLLKKKDVMKFKRNEVKKSKKKSKKKVKKKSKKKSNKSKKK